MTDNPCFNCDCYDPDMGCTMPAVDKSYACSLEDTDLLNKINPPALPGRGIDKRETNV